MALAPGVEMRRVGQGPGVVGALVADTEPVEHEQDDRTGDDGQTDHLDSSGGYWRPHPPRARTQQARMRRSRAAIHSRSSLASFRSASRPASRLSLARE